MPVLGELGRVERSSWREFLLFLFWGGLLVAVGWEGVGVGVREEKLPGVDVVVVMVVAVAVGGVGVEERCLERLERRRWCFPMARASLLKTWVTSALEGGFAWEAVSSSWGAMLTVVDGA